LRHQRWLFVRTVTTGRGPARPRRRSKFFSLKHEI
jgi:hypothetical protein